MCCLIFISPSAAQTTIAVWNFNDDNLIVDHGTGTLTSSLSSPAYLAIATSTNLYSTDVAGNALTYASVGSDQTITFQFSTLGLGAPSLTYTIESLTTGFDTIQWSYSTDGSNFTSPDTPTPITHTATLPGDLTLSSTESAFSTMVSSLSNQANVYIRGTLSNASGVGIVAFDNVQISASAVPEPSTAALLLGIIALGGVIHRRRQRAA